MGKFRIKRASINCDAGPFGCNCLCKHDLQFIFFFIGVFFLFLSPSVSQADPLTPQQRLWLDAHEGELTLAFEPNWPPVSFFTEDGSDTGIIPEYIALIEKKLGFRFRRIRYDVWADILRAGYEGEVDVLPTIVKIPEYAAYLDLTRSYFQTPVTIVMGPGATGIFSLEDMVGKKVCVVRGGASHQVLARKYPDIRLVPVDEILEGLKKVSFGEAAGLVADVAATSYLIERHGLTQLQNVGYTHFSYEVCMGISQEHPMLVEIMDRALALITPREKREILNRWLSVETRPFYQDPVFRLYAVGALVLFLGGGSLVILFWNRSLRRAVARATYVSWEAEESLRAQAVELEGTRKRVDWANRELTQVFNASTPMLIIDAKFRLLRMNDTFGSLFVVDTATTEGSFCYEVIHSPICRTDACPLIRLLSGDASPPSESLFSTMYRSDTPCLVATNALTDEGGDVIGIVVNFTDISHIMEAEEEKAQLRSQLRQSQKMEAIGTLAGGIAHDFNNILSPIIGYAEMTELSLPAESVETRNMEGILKAARRARNLVRQILTLSQYHQAELRPVHVQVVVKEALALLRSTLPMTITMIEAFHAEGRMVYSDPTQIHQIIMNLCTNAYHAMEEGTRGTLEVVLDSISSEEAMPSSVGASTGSWLRIKVRDTGVGMDDALLERIFDPYFTTKGEGKGTGLGLSVVHGIVRDSGGTITVESEPGVGTTFTLLFPETAAVACDRPLEVVERPPMGWETILVVDDEESMVDLLTQMVSRAGYRVTASVDSREALSFYRADPHGFDLVLSDMTMPEMTGFDLAREIKAINPETPVILSTGYNDRALREKAEKIGVKTFLMKPVAMRTLLTAVRRELDESKGADSVSLPLTKST